jgi:hypothetical protein
VAAESPASDPTSDLGATLANEMDAAAWTAIGLLAATSLGTLFYLGARIDGLGLRIDGLGGRIDALGSRLDARLDAFETRIDAHLDRHAAR